MKLSLLVFTFTAAVSAAVPTPESWFGHPIGADRELLDWSKVTSYFYALEKSSNRIHVEEFGRSAEGRPMVVATIADPETLRNIDQFREGQRRLADPRITSSSEAEPFIRTGKNIVLITCSIHATEVASTHSAVEFAFRLISGSVPHAREIFENDIVLLVPSINPDGLDLVTSWYRKTLSTPFEGTTPPELYQKFIGHDNNRDWYIFSQPETRAVIAQLQNRWHPEIVYDVHQMSARGARLFLPPWLDPIEPNVDATLAQEMNMIGSSMAADLTAAGFKGITINSTYDFWTPSRAYQSFHAGLRILSESASARLATPINVPFAQLSHDEPGYDAQKRSWNFLEPWPGGQWTIRNIIDYQEAAFDSCLYQAAIHREEMLRNFYAVGVRAVSRSTPAAFMIPAEQPDPGATRRLLETLAFGQVEIERTSDGSHLISMHQPYSSYAKALLEKQDYPDLRQYPGGPPQAPYDVTAHTLPLLFGVNVQVLNEAAPHATTTERFDLFSTAPPSWKSSDTDAWTTINKVWSAGGQIWRNRRTGDFAAESKGSDWFLIKRPRVALYRSWIPAMDEGWTRWLLEQFGFSYTRITNEEFQSTELSSRFDVIIFPDQPASEIENGFARGSMPEAYTGGIGPVGTKALLRFAEQGGTLLFLNRSTDFALRALNLAAKNVVTDLPSTRYYAPGSLLNVRVASGSPLTLGLPEHMAIWSEQSPAWEMSGRSAVQYPENSILASGWLLGQEFLAHRSALLDIPMGEGRVILFGMRPQYRAQSYQSFKLFFNALLLSNFRTPSPQ